MLANAANFTKDGAVLQGNYGYSYFDNRWLINDGSFEGGCGNSWNCTSDNTCNWITDLVPLGLWNYDGNMVAWLGGFCEGLATCYAEICQSVFVPDAAPWTLHWVWMGYVNDSVGRNYVTVDGNTVYEHVLTPNDHLHDYQLECAEGPDTEGFHEICFGADNNAHCAENLGDNWFVDYVELVCYIATEELSFSAVKARY